VCTAKYTGLYLYGHNNTSGTLIAEIDRTTYTNNINRKDLADSQGDRQEVQVPFRDRAPGNGNSVYVDDDWYDNGHFCWTTTTISVSAGPAQSGVSLSTSCEVGAFNFKSEHHSTHIGDSAWWFYNDYRATAPDASSMKVRIRPCQDESLSPDTCLESGGTASGRYAGISW
jgi:hypothetical protein